MPIKNYTSSISPSQSMGEIQQLLAEHRAKKIMIEYDDDMRPEAISFLMMVHQQPIQFRLTVNVEGMLRAMENDKKVPNSKCNYDQAERTAWKNKYEWLHIQLSEIESEQAEMQELLLGYAVLPDSGETVYERIKTGDMKLLGDKDA